MTNIFCNWTHWIFTVYSSSCGKVMFSQASVILSTQRGAWQGVMHGKGHAWQGACMAKGHAWQGAMRGRGGACVVGVGMCVAGSTYQGGHGGDMHGRGHVWWKGVHGRRDGHCSRWYAFSWNAFLCENSFRQECIPEGCIPHVCSFMVHPLLWTPPHRPPLSQTTPHLRQSPLRIAYLLLRTAPPAQSVSGIYSWLKCNNFEMIQTAVDHIQPLLTNDQKVLTVVSHALIQRN